MTNKTDQYGDGAQTVLINEEPHYQISFKRNLYQPLFFGFADTIDKYMLLYPIFNLTTDATVTDNFKAGEPRFYRVPCKDSEKLTITVLSKG